MTLRKVCGVYRYSPLGRIRPQEVTWVSERCQGRRTTARHGFCKLHKEEFEKL